MHSELSSLRGLSKEGGLSAGGVINQAGHCQGLHFMDCCLAISLMNEAGIDGGVVEKTVSLLSTCPSPPST